MHTAPQRRLTEALDKSSLTQLMKYLKTEVNQLSMFTDDFRARRQVDLSPYTELLQDVATQARQIINYARKGNKDWQKFITIYKEANRVGWIMNFSSREKCRLGYIKVKPYNRSTKMVVR